MISLLLAFSIALVTAWLLVASFPLPKLLENLIALPLLVSGQIVLITQSLSILHSINQTGYWIGHLVLLAVSFGTWWLRGRPDLLLTWQDVPRAVRWFFTTHNRLFMLTAIMLLYVLVRVLYGALNETYFLDAFVYHIPRALFWLQNGTAEHFFTQNFRLTEFPPNASFLYTWMLAISGSTFGLNFPQAAAALLLVLVTAALAQRAGFAWDASLFAGLMIPFTYEVGRQLGEAQIDIITAAFSASAMLYVVIGIQTHQSNKLRSNYALLYLGIAFGLSVGTKFTAIFLLPGAALAFVAYAFRLLGRGAVSILLACLFSSVIGFGFFGSYNYLLNTIAFGNPISSADTANSSDLINLGILDESYLDTMRDPSANMVRYIYQLIGVEYLESVLPLDVGAAKMVVFDTVFTKSLGIDYTLNGIPITEHTNLRTFILLFPLPLLISPLVLLFEGWRSRHSTEAFLRVAYIMMAWFWIGVIAVVATWSGVRIRLFIVIVPFIMAVVVPTLYTIPTMRYVWCALLLFSALFSVVIQFGFPTPVLPEFDRHTGEVIAPLTEDDEVIGMTGELVAIYHMMTRLPEKIYIFTPVDAIRDALIRNQVDIVFAEPQFCHEHWDEIEKITLTPPYRFMFTCAYRAR